LLLSYHAGFNKDITQPFSGKTSHLSPLPANMVKTFLILSYYPGNAYTCQPSSITFFNILKKLHLALHFPPEKQKFQE
ncbi:MAG: hypothetical protein WBL94_06325, partial [Dethiobacteria bacterium]